MCDYPDHGQVFDNCKRWCANCSKTVAAYSWKCDDCGAVWPENVEEFLAEAKENQQYMEKWH